MNLLKRSFSVMLMLVLLVSAFTGIAAFAEDSASTRWADAADEIDKYLDAAFESFLDGDAKTAYDNVSNAYFRVYETTGFERQTMSYVSGNRKNAVEMQFSTCKAAVKKDNTDLETKVKVRSALAKLKSMIREDGNKLAALQGGVQSETKYYLRGELVSSDPYADFSANPNAAAKYENWYEAATLVKELLDTAYMGYLTMDNEHLIHLTEAGEKLAREAMHETVRRGKSYHELVGQPDEDEAEGSCGQRRRLSRNQAQRWLEKERADEIPEAILILSRRYYCVRVIDIAQFLGKNSASVRTKLRQLENNNLVTIGVESVVRLTEFGREIAKALYDRHKTEREDLIRAGQSPDEAERSVLIPGARLP